MNENAYRKIVGRKPHNDIIRVLIIPGHSIDKPGAYNDKLGISEHDVVMDIATKMLKKEKDKSLSLILTSRNSYSKLPDELNYLRPDFIISLHLNAFNSEAQGTETLYYEKSSASELLAELTQKELLRLGYNDRGIKAKKRSDRGGHMLINTAKPCVIVEPFFIDSIETEEEMNENAEIVSDLLLSAIYKNFT